jgi:hypothetical protein
MENVKYKEYTPEESMIYEQAMARIRKAVGDGVSFPDACGLAEVKDSELRAFIVDDALKVIIGEMHFGKGRSLEDVAETLKVPLRVLYKAVAEMLQDAGIAAAEAYRNSSAGPVGNA